MSLAQPPQNWWTDWQRRLPPLAAPEESVALRVLVQALVLVGIVATDMAAGTATSLWAIPLSIVGAYLSWRWRAGRNLAVKFLLAAAMLAALASFFGSLLGAPNDTRLALAELLIQLQVIHSFDLPRRKDLGYSMVIGLVLLGVAGTLSQTVEFGLWLVLFSLLAVPTLALDLRSRIGLPPVAMGKLFSGSGRMLGWWLLAAGLGSVVFVLQPRLAGFQLRSFPVSAPIPLPKEFDPNRVQNPGYPGSTGGKLGPSGSTTQSQDRFDPVQYAGFNTQLDLGQRGKLQKTLMLRVRSQAPGFWRMLAFDTYTGNSWQLSAPRAQLRERSPGAPMFYLVAPNTRLATTEVIQVMSVVHEMPNLVPAAASATKLFFPSPRIAIDREGAIRVPGTLQPGLTFTVISQVPRRDVARLRKAGQAYPPAIRERYLQLPTGLDPEIGALARRVVGKVKDPYQQTMLLAQHLKQTYTLTNAAQAKGNPEAVHHLLFAERGGSPEQFATALAVLVRSQGIPARLVTGFAGGESNPFTGYIEVYNTHATAMVEAYFPGYGWLSFDPTPGRPLLPLQPDRDEPFGLAAQLWNWLKAWLPAPLIAALTQIAAILIGLAAALFAWAGSLLVKLSGFTLLAGAALLVGCAVLVVQLVRRGLAARRLARLAPPERAWQQALTLLARHKLHREAHQTPADFARLVEQQMPVGGAFSELTELYLAWRYGGQPADQAQLKALLQAVRTASKTRK